MKSTIILILFFLCFVFALNIHVNAQYKSEDFDLKGKVKSECQIHYTRGYKKRKPKCFYTNLRTFSETGNVTEFITQDCKGKESSYKITYNYDSQGKIIEIITLCNHDNYLPKRLFKYDTIGNKTKCLYYDSDDRHVRTDFYTYDDYNNLTEVNSYLYGTYISIFTNIYDGNGYDSGRINNYSGDSTSWKIIYKYDDYANKTERIVYYPGENIFERNTYTYDDYGNRIETMRYEPDGSISWKGTYKYDDCGNKTESVGYKSDGSISTIWTFKYDDTGNKIEVIYNHLGKIRFKTTCEFDDSGNQTKQICQHYYENNNLDETLYEYDNNNWVKMTFIKNGIIDGVIERKLEYY